VNDSNIDENTGESEIFHFSVFGVLFCFVLFCFVSRLERFEKNGIGDASSEQINEQDFTPCISGLPVSLLPLPS